MLDALPEQRNDVQIVHVVIDFLGNAPGCDDVHLSQSAHVMRHSCFGAPINPSSKADMIRTRLVSLKARKSSATWVEHSSKAGAVIAGTSAFYKQLSIYSYV